MERRERVELFTRDGDGSGCLRFFTFFMLYSCAIVTKVALLREEAKGVTVRHRKEEEENCPHLYRRRSFWCVHSPLGDCLRCTYK